MTAIELSANQARELTDRIKVAVEATWELIKEAYASRAWSALGYASWDDYCTREFGTSRIKLPREERQEVMASMREMGMSTRAIASATGVSDGTVRNSLKAGAQNYAPAPVTGIDGKTYIPKPRPEPDPEPETPEWEDVGTIPKSRLNDVSPPRPAPRPAPGFNPGDLDEINNHPEPPQPKSEVRKPLDEDYHDPKEHLISLMSHLKKAAKEVENAIFAAKHLDSWTRGPLSGDLRELLDELDNTLASGGFNAELARLMEEGTQ